MNVKKIVSFFSIIFLFSLVLMGIIKIWFPEIISNESFVKLTLTFAILTLGALLINFIKNKEN